MSGKLGKDSPEAFARFFEQPTREGLRDVLRTHAGELDELDFKRSWPAFPKVARTMLGLANSGGGAIVFGVENETLTPVGLETLTDKADVHNGVSRFLPSALRYSVLDFSYTDSEYGALKGKRFQVLLVEDDPEHLPFVSEAHGDGIRPAAIYVRDGTESREASHEDLQRLINRRLETGRSTTRELELTGHLDELRALFHELSPYAGLKHSLGVDAEKMMAMIYEKNPAYPRENLDWFVARMIAEKKKVIEAIVLKRPAPSALSESAGDQPQDAAGSLKTSR